MMLLLVACGTATKQENLSEDDSTISQESGTDIETPPEVVTTRDALDAEETAQKQLCDDILAKEKERIDSILDSPTQVSISGTSYYVSVEWDDSNDGLTEDTPWPTASKVNEIDLKPGDGVFFRRGDTWRMDMINNYLEGIMYSAYGEGAKPVFCGSIVMNGGEIVATQHYPIGMAPIIPSLEQMMYLWTLRV